MRSIIVATACVAAARAADADGTKLDEARAAIEAVRYDDARGLLEDALQRGGNSPAELTEIYRLSASTEIVLGHRALADTYFRSWLALDPQASLPTDAATKFRDPFIAAQAFVRERGPLRIRVGTSDERTIAVVFESDPLAIAVSVSLDAVDPRARTRIGPAHRVTLRVPAGKGMVRVFAFDQFGNRVYERAFATFSAIPRERVAETALYRRWPVWAVPALLFAGTGAYFFTEARQAQAQLDDIARSRGKYFYSDVVRATDRRDLNHKLTFAMSLGAGVCAAVAIAMFATRPAKPVVVPTADTGPGVSLIGTF